MPVNGTGKFPADQTPRTLIVGASTRAAAWSALRGGFQPVCADQFADRDLQQIADVVSVTDYPATLCKDLLCIAGLPSPPHRGRGAGGEGASGVQRPKPLTRTLSPARGEGTQAETMPSLATCWMFVGAMENHRRLLQELQSEPRFGRYCGPSLDAIRDLRDPLWLADRLRPGGSYPAVIVPDRDAVHAESLPAGRWLRKPLAGGGGRGIHLATAEELSRARTEPCYWQRQIDGVPFSALFLVTTDQVRLLMVSQQLIGVEDAAAPTPFAYCGSIGPWSVSEGLSAQLTETGSALVDGLDYRGLMGIDLIWNGQHAWVVEVNPRYPASTELWELATGQSAVAEHLQAFEVVEVPRAFPSPPSATAGQLLGKLILFADRPVISPNLDRCLAARDPWSLPWIADIPATESRIAAGWPICTVFASGRTAADCRKKLLRRAHRVRSWFRDS